MPRDDRTEKATPKRRGEARKKGQVAKSNDLNGALVLIVGLFAISSLAPTVVSGAAAAMRDSFAQIASSGTVTTGAGLGALLQSTLSTLLGTVAPIAGACLGVGVLANVAQVGFRPSLTALKPDVKRISPSSGAKNLFGTRIFFETGKSLAKVGVVGAVAAFALLPQLTRLGAGVGTPPGALGHLLGSSATAIAQRAAI